MARKTKAVIIDATGLVDNIIAIDDAIDPPFNPGPGKTLMDPTGAQTGGTWNGTVFLPPPNPPPPTPEQILRTRAGKLDMGRLTVALVRSGAIPKADVPADQLDALNALTAIDGKAPL